MRLLNYLVVFSFLLLTFCQSSTVIKKPILGEYEIKGVSFVGMYYKNELDNLQKLKDFNITWISQMPFAFQKMNDPQIHFKHDKQWWGESKKGIVETTNYSRVHEIKNMLKPQIWMQGNYTGNFTLIHEKDWVIWEENYSTYILYFAKLADSLHHDAFCIGTELHQTVLNRPRYWNKLIDTIRTFYDGKLTYASNWNEYKDVTFWKKLDFIGIDAYFPLSKSKTPKTKALINSWKKIIPTLRLFSDSIKKPILFTEIGYKSVDSCANEPWNPASKTINHQAQFNAYEAFLCAFKDQKKWFKGYFLWKWYPQHEKSGGENNGDYTPQNKLVEKLLKK